MSIDTIFQHKKLQESNNPTECNIVKIIHLFGHQMSPKEIFKRFKGRADFSESVCSCHLQRILCLSFTQFWAVLYFRWGEWRFLPDPPAALSGDCGDQHRRHRSLLHPGGHILQHLHRLHPKCELLRRELPSLLWRSQLLAACPHLRHCPQHSWKEKKNTATKVWAKEDTVEEDGSITE